MAIWSNSPTMKPSSVGTSRPQNTSVGSGSRPTKSSIMIDTSAPENSRTLGGRGNVSGALGMGMGSSKQG